MRLDLKVDTLSNVVTEGGNSFQYSLHRFGKLLSPNFVLLNGAVKVTASDERVALTLLFAMNIEFTLCEDRWHL